MNIVLNACYTKKFSKMIKKYESAVTRKIDINLISNVYLDLIMLKCKFSIPKTLYLMDQKRRFVSSTHDSLTFFCFIRLSSSFFKLKNYFISFFVFIRNFISCSLELESTYSNEILMKAWGTETPYFKKDIFMFNTNSS